MPVEIKVDNPLGEYRDRRVYLVKYHINTYERYAPHSNDFITIPEKDIWLITDDWLAGDPGEWFIYPGSDDWESCDEFLDDAGYKRRANAMRKIKTLPDFLDYSLPPDYSRPVPLF